MLSLYDAKRKTDESNLVNPSSRYSEYEVREMIAKGQYAIICALPYDVVANGTITDDEVQQLSRKLHQTLADRKMDYFSVSGKYDGVENNHTVLIPHIKQETARLLAKEFEQFSWIFADKGSNRLEYLRDDESKGVVVGDFYQGRGVFYFPERPADNFSSFQYTDEFGYTNEFTFSLNFDFSQLSQNTHKSFSAENDHSYPVVTYENNQFYQMKVASEDGNTSKVEALLKAGVNPNIILPTGLSPLHYAAMNGHTKVVTLLLGHSAEVDITSGQLETPLWWAAKEGHTDIVEKLLDKGANPSTMDLSCETALHGAMTDGHKRIAEMLIENGANPYVLNQDAYETPLEVTADEDLAEHIKTLYERKANIKVKPD